MPYNIYKTVHRFGIEQKKIESIISLTLKALKKQNYELSLHLVGDRKMLALNRGFRNIERTTDVLAFAAQDGAITQNNDLGDIFISCEQIKRQARARGIPYREEFARILIHGLLHLLGFDHGTPKQEKEMFGIQEKIVGEVLKSPSK